MDTTATVEVLASTITTTLDGIVTEETNPATELETKRYSPIITFTTW